MVTDGIDATFLVIDALEDLSIPYVIGGSLASTFHGVMRMTLDTDIVADMQMGQAELFANALAGAFYVDAESARDAIRKRSSFNVIHLASMFKVDIFIPRARPFDRKQMERRQPQAIAARARTVYVATAEDTILAKLEWYRLGEEVSERQWRDVLGIVAAQRGRLDMGYLREWATALDVSDLLERALETQSKAN